MTVKRSKKLKIAPSRETFELDVLSDPEVPTVQNELKLLNEDSKSLNKTHNSVIYFFKVNTKNQLFEDARA